MSKTKSFLEAVEDRIPVRTTKFTVPLRHKDGELTGGVFGPSDRLQSQINRAARGAARIVLTDKNLNPAGKARVTHQGKSTEGLNKRTVEIDTYFAPDANHAARLRGKATKKKSQ